MPSLAMSSTTMLFPNLHPKLRELSLLYIRGTNGDWNPEFLTHNEIDRIGQSQTNSVFNQTIIAVVNTSKAIIISEATRAKIHIQKQIIEEKTKQLLRHKELLQESDEYKNFNESAKMITEQHEELILQLEELYQEKEGLLEELIDIETPLKVTYEQRAEAIDASGLDIEITLTLNQMIDDIIDQLVEKGTIPESDKDQAKAHMKEKINASQSLSTELSLESQQTAEHIVTTELIDQNLAHDPNGFAEHTQSLLEFKTAAILSLFRHKITHQESFTSDPELNLNNTYTPTLQPTTNADEDKQSEASLTATPTPSPALSQTDSSEEAHRDLFREIEATVNKAHAHASPKLQQCIHKANEHMDELTQNSQESPSETTDLAEKSTELSVKANNLTDQAQKTSDQADSLDRKVDNDIKKPADEMQTNATSKASKENNPNNSFEENNRAEADKATEANNAPKDDKDNESSMRSPSPNKRGAA